jgi:hypothetical protein
MTLPLAAARARWAKARAVLRLHRAPAMRLSSVAFAIVTLLAVASPARADNFSCKPGGNGAMASFTLAAKRGDNDFVTMAPTVIANVINFAECQCDSTDLYVVAQISRAITATGLQQSVWEGTSCDTTATVRLSSCEQIADDNGIAGFTQGSYSGTARQRVHVQSLVTPLVTGTTAHSCPASTVPNLLYFLWYSDPNSPDSCSVQLTYSGLPTTPATGLSAGSGDEAVVLNWNGPASGASNKPSYYQVLCATKDSSGSFVPVPGQGAYAFGESGPPHALGYSVCTDPANHTIQRQVVATGSAGTGTTSTDAGTSSSTDMARQSEPLSGMALGGGLGGQRDPLRAQADPVDLGVSSTCSSFGDPDMGNAQVFGSLDKSFVCSDKLAADTTSTRIGGLNNQQAYYFTVVAIDTFGNPSPTSPVCAVPRPVEDLYRRFLDAGGKSQGFCFIATAAYGSYQSPFVMVLRDFRDRVLLPSPAGARFVAWYYRSSPPLAAWISPRPWARFAVRLVLWPVIALAGLWMWLTPAEGALLLALALALVISRRRRAAGQPARAEPEPQQRRSEGLRATGSAA